MQYSISDLEQLSGVQAHTIRMWEQRYNVLKPHRSAGNRRFYDDAHLVKLLNVVSINQKGLKISKICKLSQQEIHNILQEEIQANVGQSQASEFYITQLLNYGMAYKESEIDELLTKCIKESSLTQVYVAVIYPLLVRLGLMWRKDSICIAQEHFLTNIIRQRICSAIHHLPPVCKSNRTWLLFLPEEEEHEIGILFANYLLRKAKKHVIYLGGRVPLASVKQVISSTKVDNIMLFMVQQKSANSAQKYVDELADLNTDAKIYLAGNSALLNELQLTKNIKSLRGINEFENLINESSC